MQNVIIHYTSPLKHLVAFKLAYLQMSHSRHGFIYSFLAPAHDIPSHEIFLSGIHKKTGGFVGFLIYGSSHDLFSKPSSHNCTSNFILLACTKSDMALSFRLVGGVVNILRTLPFACEYCFLQSMFSVASPTWRL